ncbi:unnamed protein product, partial [Cylicostephanus goldi]
HNITCHYGVGLTYDGPVCYCPTDQISEGDRCVAEDKCDRRFRGEQSGSFVAVLGNTFVLTSTVQWEYFPTRFQRTINQNRRMIAAAADTKRNWICYVLAAVKADPLTYAFMECSKIAKKSSKIMKSDITASFPLDGMLHLYNNMCENWSPVIGELDPLTYAFMECSKIAKKSSKIMKSDITASFPLDEVRVMQHDSIGDNWLFLIGRTRVLICKNEWPKMEKCRIVVDDLDIENFAVDPSFGLIFYSTVGKNAGVWQVTYENSTKLSMSDRQLQMPGGLAVDAFSQTLYYSDRYFERIFAVDYGRNGTVRNVLHDKRVRLLKVSGICFFENCQL